MTSFGPRHRQLLQVAAALTAGFLVGVALSPPMPTHAPTTPAPNPARPDPLHAVPTLTDSTTTTTTTPTPSAAHTPTQPRKMCYSSVAERLTKEVRILCLIVTYPAHHATHALPIYRTWGRRCSHALFVTNNATVGVGEGQEDVGEQERVEETLQSKEVQELSFLVVPETENGKEGLWNKTKYAFSHAYKHYLYDYDWFLKADDDTYIIMENLRYWLHDKDTEEALYYGSHFKPFAPKGYMSGGAGYVLSRGALKEFYRATNSTPDSTYTEEDLEMGTVLASAGVYPRDSRDKDGRPLFFPLDITFMVLPREKDHEFWYWKTLAHDHPTGLQCCSSHTISFHYITGSLLYQLEFLIYHLKLFGVSEAPGPC